MNRRAIYTAIFGGYDPLRPIDAPPDVDLIAFTDDPKLACPGWDVHVIPTMNEHPRITAKRYKCLPHSVLLYYDETVWVDGSFEALGPAFAREVFGYLADAPIALYRHPARDCIYEEAAVSDPLPKYRGRGVLEQVAHYRALHFPEHAGLYAGGLIARRTFDPRVVRFGDAWLDQNLRWTYQDQLSLPVVLAGHGLVPATFDHGQYSGRWGRWHVHATEL